MRKLADKVRTGQCGPMPPAVPQSWGAACPSGTCTSADLAASLNRAFAGEKMGCKEIPYILRGTSTAGGALTLAQNALITICPTRIMVDVDDGILILTGSLLTAFTIGAQNQILGDPIPTGILNSNSYAIIPFVTDCIKAGTPFSLSFTGMGATQAVTVTLIGPAIG